MGTWGAQPWENDEAMDWFASLLAESGFAEEVERTLRENPSESPEEIRAAAFIIGQLGRPEIWPHENLDACLQLAKSRLMALLRNTERYPNDDVVREFQSALRSEIAMIDERMQR